MVLWGGKRKVRKWGIDNCLEVWLLVGIYVFSPYCVSIMADGYSSFLYERQS
jgi:hypothetical protein